ncbi:MAG: helicase, partial [Chloroflexi bacterium]|nr:helicase [Chloroflexota bacterium]
MNASSYTGGSSPPASSVEVREQLVEALRLDLVGPWAGHRLETEQLPNYTRYVRPSNWYLTGFLVPPDIKVSEEAKADASDDLDETPANAGTAEESSDDGRPARRGYFPSSMGLSFLIDGGTNELAATVRWGDYAPASIDGNLVWRRTPREERTVVRIPETGEPEDWPIPDSNGLALRTVARTVQPGTMGKNDEGSRSVSIFLLNRRKQDSKEPVEEDRLYAFQPEIEVRSERPLPSKPIGRSAKSNDWDEDVAELHYADTPEYATGHGVSADWGSVDGACHLVRTAWIGQASVEVTSTSSVTGVELSMQALGSLQSGADAKSALMPLVGLYRQWIEAERNRAANLQGRHKETAEELLRLAQIAASRIERGIDVLASDADVLDAFRVANRSIAHALERRLEIADPAWRAFQLAFILLNLPGIADPTDSHRKTVDLLFFPTGGGKTEAYLGLAAITMVLRRLRHSGSLGHAAGGVSVVMRYTLRLLTLDQLARASGLVCALELEREKNPGRYGVWPFEIGLWVGTAATPNRMGAKGDRRQGTARSKVNQFKSDPARNPSPIPLEECPWCGERFEPDSFTLEPDSDRPSNLSVVCTNFDCDFTGDRALPIVAVDEPLYRRLPAFLVATVDKFASLPWTGESGTLLGGADRYDANGFYGACNPDRGTKLEIPLSPPDLIIQD